VLIIFYLIGCAVQIVIDINFKPMEENEEQESSGETEEGSKEENTEEEQQEEEEPLPDNLEDIQSES
jgi:hypothetical protein